jgi:membrane-bound lytic murein transglycosylase B
MKKIFIIIFSLSLLLFKFSYAHDPKNCDVLENYDFSQFDNWKSEVIKNAPEYGLGKNFVQSLVKEFQVNKRVIENDKCQPEFTLTFSEYIDKRISNLRVKNGINKYNKYNSLLQKIKKVYNVQPRFIISIWGLETAYGEITGNYPVIESLLTMSYDERRRRYFTKELYNSFKIIEEGHVDLENFKGSWAGAMGQNQFMPSSFLNYAQDFNNDGKKNIWTDIEDSLASIGRYLQGVGSNKWDPNYTWGREVIPPENIKELEKELFIKREKGCLAIKKLSKKIPLSKFREMNFQKLNGQKVDNLGIDSYLVRMGREENDFRYFIVYNNYLNILSYNCSNYYALSVGLLSDKIK